MSLLMDALRKAEESKRRVAQRQKSDAEQAKQATAEAEKGTANTPASPSSEAAQTPATAAETEASATVSTPELSVDFEDSSAEGVVAEVEDNVASRASSESDSADEDGKRSKPQDSQPDNEPKLEIKATALNIGLTPKVQPKIETVAYEPKTEEETEEETEAKTKTEEKAEAKTAEKQQQKEQKQAPPQAQQRRPGALQIQEREGLQEREPATQQRQESATQQRQESGELQIQAREEPGQGDQENKEKAAPKHSDRNLAKALFLAKRGRPSSARYLPLFGLGTVVVVLAGLAGYFYLLPGGGLEFTVPSENNLAIGPTSPALPQTAATELSSGIEVANAAIVAATPPDGIGLARSGAEPSNGSSQAISQIVGGPVGNDAIIESPLGTEPSLPDLQPSRSETAVDSSPISASAVEVVVLPEIVPSTTTAGTIADSAASAGAAEPVDRISFSRQQVISSIDPLASEAYAAYRRGNLDEAEGLYRQVLVDSPRHRDALLGLVAIATGKDETGVAMDLYSRLLDRDPADPVAHAGLLELMPSGSPGEQERQLKRLAERHPEVAPLAYALGNFYASARRWTDAQKSYFRALRLAKNDALEAGHVNPDYAFNLAISLEHMNQAQAASDYYQQALDFADNHPAGFDLNVVRGRLENISRMASR
ncbi:MAG: tetratricopeptide repeat protein [Proteobacteria bacterium]|nr:tetratricopeptide repeat protein [Pseudomonadota bacterium]